MCWNEKRKLFTGKIANHWKRVKNLWHEKSLKLEGWHQKIHVSRTKTRRWVEKDVCLAFLLELWLIRLETRQRNRFGLRKSLRKTKCKWVGAYGDAIERCLHKPLFAVSLPWFVEWFIRTALNEQKRTTCCRTKCHKIAMWTEWKP